MLLLTLIVAAVGCAPKQQPLAGSRADVSQNAPAQGRRIALVVGNGRYASSPLANPPNDAGLIATTLTGLGFEVRLQKNADQAGMKRAIQDFGDALEKAGPDSIGLFYYAGHGVQLNGRNYLIPVAANINRDADVEIEAVSADWVLEQMRYARNRLNFVILDACRNNPFARSFRSADHGLAKMDAPAGVLIAYSTAPGDVAADGEGGNSPYSEALARAMRDSDEPAELMFKQARDAVRRATSDRQTPWEASSLTGQNFYFATAAHSLASPAPVARASANPPDTDRVPTAPPNDVVSPVSNLAGSVNQKREVTDEFANAPPTFMSDALCAHAVGEWRIESDAMTGAVKLNEKAAGVARQNDKSGTIPVRWTCDAANRGFIVRYEGDVVHKVTMDASEKLMFGYDQAGTPVIYTR
jgi:uncharacterized caspase-like protein